MLTDYSPPVLALMIMIAIPAIATALIRRHDSARPPRSERGVPAGALFVVHGRRWTHVMIRVFGIVFIVVGGVIFLTGFAELPDAGAVFTFALGFIVAVFGIGFVLLAVGMKRRCVEAYDGYLLVVPMFRAVLTVRPEDIKRIRPSLNRMGGLDIKVHGRFSVFSVISIDHGYPEFCGWLERSAPEQWGEFARVFGN
ncbi:hypothetical protein ACIPC2_00110 [Curtobacterium pusillum]|uniref:hypothetical protein n=1 Tax=Curtobacterium pusillum TaxID=69373 RepID=UPI0037F5A324